MSRFKKGDIPWNKGKKLTKIVGKKNPNYRGGRSIMSSGYVRVLIEGVGSYELEHRLVMENFLGRKLEKGEIVHHKNGNKQDNRIENLELMTNSGHTSRNMIGNKFMLGRKLSERTKKRISKSCKSSGVGEWMRDREQPRDFLGRFIRHKKVIYY